MMTIIIIIIMIKPRHDGTRPPPSFELSCALNNSMEKIFGSREYVFHLYTKQKIVGKYFMCAEVII